MTPQITLTGVIFSSTKTMTGDKWFVYFIKSHTNSSFNTSLK